MIAETSEDYYARAVLRVRAIHTPREMTVNYDDGPQVRVQCRECFAPYPCPTIQALKDTDG